MLMGKDVASCVAKSRQSFSPYVVEFARFHCPLSQSTPLCLLHQPPAVEDEDDLKKQKDEAQIRVMLWLEMEKDGEENKSHFHDEVKLIGGEFSIYAETVCIT